jgi:SAM-dependent methyltransferase
MTGNQPDYRAEWESSYARRDNFLFYPHEEVIRFVSRYLRKRVGVAEFRDVAAGAGTLTGLDLGCGIGRHVFYCEEMGLRAYGIDLSATALSAGREWFATRGKGHLNERLVQGDITRLPWPPGFFDYAVSHGVLDSVPFEAAQAACAELARVLKPGGLFYCDLVSGDDSRHAREYAGAEIVTTAHEQGTVQVYFNFALVATLFRDAFDLLECNLIRREDVLKGARTSRYHVVARRR